MDTMEVEQLSRRMDNRLRKLGLSEADREDIRQQVLLEYLVNRGRVRNPRAWVGIVAYRKGLSSIYCDRLVPLEFEPRCEYPEEERLDVRRAFERGTAESRELVMRRFLHGEKLREFADCGLGSLSTVKRNLRRAEESFRRRVGARA